MRNLLSFIQVTLIGGVLFLMPFAIAVFFLGKIGEPLHAVSEPLAAWVGVDNLAGVAMSEIIVIVLLVLAAFVAGLIGRTSMGQSFIDWMRSGLASVMPGFGLIDSLAQSFNKDTADLPVVLVPTDAGWTLAVLVDPPHEGWCTVFVPGAPEVFSGSVAYARAQDVRPTALKPADLFRIMRGRGVGSAAIHDHLMREERLAAAPPVAG